VALGAYAYFVNDVRGGKSSMPPSPCYRPLRPSSAGSTSRNERVGSELYSGHATPIRTKGGRDEQAHLSSATSGPGTVPRITPAPTPSHVLKLSNALCGRLTVGGPTDQEGERRLVERATTADREVHPRRRRLPELAGQATRVRGLRG